MRPACLYRQLSASALTRMHPMSRRGASFEAPIIADAFASHPVQPVNASRGLADGAIGLMPFISYLQSHQLKLSAGRIEVIMSMEPFAEGPSRWSSSSRSPSGVLERPGSFRDVRAGPDASGHIAGPIRACIRRRLSCGHQPCVLKAWRFGSSVTSICLPPGVALTQIHGN